MDDIIIDSVDIRKLIIDKFREKGISLRRVSHKLNINEKQIVEWFKGYKRNYQVVQSKVQLGGHILRYGQSITQYNICRILKEIGITLKINLVENKSYVCDKEILTNRKESLDQIPDYNETDIGNVITKRVTQSTYNRIIKGKQDEIYFCNNKYWKQKYIEYGKYLDIYTYTKVDTIRLVVIGLSIGLEKPKWKIKTHHKRYNEVIILKVIPYGRND